MTMALCHYLSVKGIFNKVDAAGVGYVGGRQAVALFAKSGVANADLGTIWRQVDGIRLIVARYHGTRSFHFAWQDICTFSLPQDQF